LTDSLVACYLLFLNAADIIRRDDDDDDDGDDGSVLFAPTRQHVFQNRVVF